MRNLQALLTDGCIVTLDYLEGGRHVYRDGYVDKEAIRPLECRSLYDNRDKDKGNINLTYTYIDNFDDNLIAVNSTLTTSTAICAIYRNTDDWAHKRAYWRRMYDYILILANREIARNNSRITTSCLRFNDQKVGAAFLDLIDITDGDIEITKDTSLILEEEDRRVTVDISKTNRQITISY